MSDPRFHKPLHVLDRCFLIIISIGTSIVCLALLGVAIFGGADVVGTFVLGRPLPLARELPEVILPTIVFLGASIAIRTRALVRIDFFDPFLSEHLASVSRGVSFLCCLAFFVLMAWFGWSMAVDSFSKGETANALIRFPVWPFKLAMAVSISLCVVEQIRLLWSPEHREPGDEP